MLTLEYVFYACCILLLVFSTGLIIAKLLHAAIHGCLVKGHDWEIVAESTYATADNSRTKKKFLRKCKRCGKMETETHYL